MNIQDLEIVTYDETAVILGKVKQTIRDAVSRGVLTPLPRQRRKPGRLIKKQVELFVGKELSLANLSHSEAVQWHEINRVVNASKRKRNAAPSLAYADIEDVIEIYSDLLDRVADLFVDVIREIVTSKDFDPDTVIAFMKQSPALQRINELMGMSFTDMPDDTLAALDRRARKTVARVEEKLKGLFAEFMAGSAMFQLMTLPQDKLFEVFSMMNAASQNTEQEPEQETISQ